MKKQNNKFRNNNYNPIYSLNYKFDSVSPAGKVCGTALDLIKKYNELAKEALNNGDYVAAETFRQYAEHYRKIVTEINEKKNQRQAAAQARDTETRPEAEAPAGEQPAEQTADLRVAEIIKPEFTSEKKEFKIIEINAADSRAELIENHLENKQPGRRGPRRRNLKNTATKTAETSEGEVNAAV